VKKGRIFTEVHLSSKLTLF